MKKVLALILCMLLVFAVAAMAGLTGTPHDLSGGAGEICVACHTPHAAVAATEGPLWNRSAPAAVYTYYTSATFDMSAPALSLGPQSLACMTCHNGLGSTIVNGPGSGVGTTAPYAVAASGTNSIGSNAFSNIGTDLTNDHPVGFTYVAGPDTQGENFPAVGAGNLIAGTYPIFGGTKFECGTCHDVHNTVTYPGQGATQVNFLKASNAGSAMCGACHISKF